MKDFEQRKIEYFKKLKENPELLDSIMKKTEEDNENNIRLTEIILDPKNERELDIAEMTYTFGSDMLSMMEDAFSDNLETIPLEDNLAVKYFVGIIKDAKENKNVNGESAKKTNDKESKTIDVKEAARLAYDSFVGFFSEPEETVEYIARQCGFDLDDSIQLMQFQLYLNKAKLTLDKTNPTSRLVDDLSDEQVKEGKEFVDEFHRIYMSNKKEEEQEDEDEFIRKLIQNILRKMD